MHILNDSTMPEAKKIALTDSSAKKVTKWLYYNFQLLLLFYIVVKAGSFVEVKIPEAHGIVEESLLKKSE